MIHKWRSGVYTVYLIFTIEPSQRLCSARAISQLAAIGNLFFSLHAEDRSFAGVSPSRIGADIQRRERRERGAKETAFLSQIGTDEMEGWKKKERMGKVKKAKTPLGDVSYGHGGFFLEYLMTREPRRE